MADWMTNMNAFTVQYSSLKAGYLPDPSKIVDNTIEETDAYNWHPLGKEQAI